MTPGATVLGIDLATAGARCVALDARTGAVLATARRDLPRPARSEGGHSRQPAAYGDVALALLEEVCRELPPNAPPVRAVSVTGTSGTVVATDAAGRPLADARLYDDTSAATVLDRAAVRRAATLGRARLLLDEVPDARVVLTSADVALSALAGRLVAGDTSHWLKAGVRLSSKDFEEPLLEVLGVPRDRLPELVIPGTVVGTVHPAIASRLGLPDGVLLVAGMTDGCTAQVSTGAVHEGDTMGVLGTTLVLKGVSATEVGTADGAVYSHLGPDGRFWPGGASNSGGGVLASEFPSGDAAVLDAVAAAHGPSSVVRYPLARPGERFPVADRAMADLLSGAPRDHVDAYSAVLDGVALVERLGLERLAALGVPSRRHVLAGGGSRSPVWNSIRAALVGPAVAASGDAPVVLVQGAGSAVGAALLAVAGAADEPLAAVVDRLVPSPAPVQPDERTAAAATDLWERFRRLLAESGHDLAPVPAPTH
ncbi:MAG: FGGY family carbohydrate kinase [Intrasporangium sp.]|uniref:FGGY family carbohydrate kinase n=1 Tax=Intrasporangium sp. TaxID=1925024 RepID=UPI003F806A14